MLVLKLHGLELAQHSFGVPRVDQPGQLRTAVNPRHATFQAGKSVRINRPTSVSKRRFGV